MTLISTDNIPLTIGFPQTGIMTRFGQGTHDEIYFYK